MKLDTIIFVLSVIAIAFIILLVSAVTEAAPIRGVALSPVPSVKAICLSGYTATIRPSVSYTNALKKKLVPIGHSISEYELDHFIPLELGGDPKSVENLWMQPWPDARKKDQLEDRLHREVCKGQITLSEAQSLITTWK